MRRLDSFLFVGRSFLRSFGEICLNVGFRKLILSWSDCRRRGGSGETLGAQRSAIREICLDGVERRVGWKKEGQRWRKSIRGNREITCRR